MKTTIAKAFDYFPGNHDLTEETIYNYKPISKEDCIPIYSGSQDNILATAFINNKAFNKKGKKVIYFYGPCLILTKDGSAGLLTFKGKNEGIFTINHHACVLKVKNNWRKRIDPEWFCLQFKDKLFQCVTSKSDNMVFSTEWFERIFFEIPSSPVQASQKSKKIRLLRLIEFVDNFIKIIDRSLINTSIMTEGNSEKLGNIFNFKGGNNGLTEDFIYRNQPKSLDESIKIYSSATIESNLMGYISKDARPNNKKLRIFNGPSILTARNGYAGTMTLIQKNLFTTNDHAYVLTPKKRWKARVNLRWFLYQYQNRFYNLVTSKSDNATFNKDYAQKIDVIIPDIDFQNKIAARLMALDELNEQLLILKEKAVQLIRRPLI